MAGSAKEEAALSGTVWVTGAGGLIGGELARRAADHASRWRVIPLLRRDLDLEDGDAVLRRFERERPRVVVHCAGLTRGPQCEADPERARRLNVDLTRRLAGLSPDTVLVFFSTDLVFDGRDGGYSEDAEPRPRGVYAETKREGELVVLGQARHLVVRTTLTYGHSATGDRSFNEDMVAAVRAGRRLKLFTDEYRCPIPVEATARAVWELVDGLVGEGEGQRPSGIYHLGGAERLSRWEIGECVARLNPELRGMLDPSSIREYQGPPRPADSSMRCERIRRWLRSPLPGFRSWVERQVAGGAAGAGV